jgi:hypothetical protein
MVQRMGRILRRKRPGISARFVIMFAKDTVEDPGQRIERDGFIDEIECIAEPTRVFDGARYDELDAFLAAPGPAVVPEPEHLERFVGVDPETSPPETAYALLAFAPRAPLDAPALAMLEKLDARLPTPSAERPYATRPYLEPELIELPRITKPRLKPKRLSTGNEALEIARVGSSWRISCTGCGESSPLVDYRWQLFDQTVDCRCA